MRQALIIACCSIWSVAYAFAQGGGGLRQPRPLPPDLPDANPYTSPADVALGRRLYAGRCGHCHGQDGEGGRGAVLNSGQFRHGGTDRELFATIRNGIPNTEMPGAFNLPLIEIWRLVAYVQQLGRQGASEPATGNAEAGAKVYDSNGCAACHAVGGQGGFVGPDLTDIGAKRAIRHLRQSIVDPDADIALDFRTVSVVDRGGKSVIGIHLNEDEYAVHLLDVTGNLRTFMKSDLTDLKLPRTSLMPRYASLSATELEDLVAYLASLGSRRQRSTSISSDATTWTFDRLDNIGGETTTVLGEPKVIDSPVGKAVEFDGIDDALFVDRHPLAGAAAFTWEAIFRPDGGQREQRWFHLSERDPATGADTDNRMLFEIRVVEDKWFLDCYAESGGVGKALMNRQALHPLGAWYHVACVYDGKELSSYVDRVREVAAPLQLAPAREGHASIGVRINKVYYFKGAVRLARFTKRALSPEEFLTRSAP
jgi:putative heme-binding domain-containing protein